MRPTKETILGLNSYSDVRGGENQMKDKIYMSLSLKEVEIVENILSKYDYKDISDKEEYKKQVDCILARCEQEKN